MPRPNSRIVLEADGSNAKQGRRVLVLLHSRGTSLTVDRAANALPPHLFLLVATLISRDAFEPGGRAIPVHRLRRLLPNSPTARSLREYEARLATFALDLKWKRDGSGEDTISLVLPCGYSSVVLEEDEPAAFESFRKAACQTAESRSFTPASLTSALGDLGILLQAGRVADARHLIDRERLDPVTINRLLSKHQRSEIAILTAPLHGRIADFFMQHAEPGRALRSASAAIRAARDNDQPAELVYALCTKVAALRMVGKFVEAGRAEKDAGYALNMAVKTVPEHEVHELRITMRASTSVAPILLGEYGYAEKQMLSTLEEATIFRSPMHACTARLRLCQIALSQNEVSQAVEHLNAARVLLSQIPQLRWLHVWVKRFATEVALFDHQWNDALRALLRETFDEAWVDENRFQVRIAVDQMYRVIHVFGQDAFDLDDRTFARLLSMRRAERSRQISPRITVRSQVLDELAHQWNHLRLGGQKKGR